MHGIEEGPLDKLCEACGLLYIQHTDAPRPDNIATNNDLFVIDEAGEDDFTDAVNITGTHK
ncbi:MAG: hypothetical protein HRT38_17050 [Alteromonadaceae bacterium]|nr:hypothetical protein [Alteromonadaceae bacterium]